MKTKTLSLLLCLIAVTSSVLISCSEDLGFGNKIEQDETNIVSVAKQIYQNQGSSVCLPNPKANKNNASRSSFSYLAELDPLWNEAFTYNQGTDTVVIVPLNCDNEIRSNLSIIEGDETTYQFAKVFSRMIVKPSEGENGIYVLSYMPESNYASSYPNLEAEMGYNPTEVDFTGLIVSSRITGEVMKGFLYNEGVLGHYFAPVTQECHDHNCTENHNHNHEHKGLSLKFNLQNANQSRSTTYSSRSESGEDNENSGNMEEICEKCWNKKKDCICVCWDCGFHIDYCICVPCGFCNKKKSECICDNTEEKKEVCQLCGAVYELAGDHNCGATLCPVCKNADCTCNLGATEPCKYCGEDPCVCNEPDPVDTCDICKQEICICCKICNTYPCECCEKCGEHKDSCICVTNTTPILYTPHDNDFMILKDMEDCVVNNTCSALAALETACSIYESSVTQNDLYTYYTYLYNMTPEESFVLDTNSDFMVDLFMFSTTQNIKSTIEYGVPVIVRFGNCYITVVGIQYDGDIIYANHDNGNLYAVEKDYFNNYENIVIEGVPQELPNPYLLNQ